MKKKFSMVLIFVLLLNTLSNSAVFMSQATTEPEQRSIFGNLITIDQEGQIVEPSELEVGAVTVELAWSVVERSVNDGYSETVTLIDELNIDQEQNGELIYKETEIGRYQVTEDNTVTVTFNEEIETHNEAEGKLVFTAQVAVNNEAVKSEAEVEQQDEEVVQEKNVSEDKQVPADNEKIAHTSAFSALAGSAIAENLIQGVTAWNNPDQNGMPTDNSEQLQDIRANTGETLSLVFAWELEQGHSYQAGDHFTFSLPDKFLQNIELTGNLPWENTIVGDYVISPEGEITFTFNEQINDGQGFSGDFYIWRQFDSSKWQGETRQELVFEFDGESISIPVHFEKDSSPEITKGGQAKKDGVNNTRNADTIEWIVDFNLGERHVTAAEFKDTLPSGLVLDLNSVRIYELAVQLNGNVSQGAEVSSAFNPDVAGNAFTIDFGNIDKAYRVVYETSVPLPSGETPDYRPSYRNDVVITGNDGAFSQNQSHSVTIQFNEPLNKGVESYDANLQEIEWVINFNFNQQPVIERLIDTFDTDHQTLDLDSFEVYEVTINASGEPTNPVQLDNGSDYDVHPNNEGFELAFASTDNKAYQIYYKTRATNRVYDDQVTVENNVKIGNDGESEPASQDIGQVIFNKSNGVIDYANKVITWTLTINRDNKFMEDTVVTDTFANQGLNLDPGSLLINGSPITTQQLAANPTYQEGFTLALGDIDETYIITYDTIFDPTYFDINEINPQYRNNARLDWTNKTAGTPSMEKSGTVTPRPYMVNNGDKTVEYDAQTKELTWTIDINFNRHTINEPVLRDFYSAGQAFVNDSLTVYELTVNHGNGGTVTEGNAISDNAYSYTMERDENGLDGFELTFNHPIDSPYRIVYRTTLEGEAVLSEYTNNATLIDADEPNKLLFSREAREEPRFGNEFINKAVSQGTGANQTTAFWTLNINRSNSYIDRAIVNDTLSNNQTYYQDTFKLYETQVASNGVITKGTEVDSALYNIEFSVDEETWEESFELTFSDEIEEPYILEYETFINANHGDDISNTASLLGHVVDNAIDSSEQDHTASFQGGAGGVVYATGGAELTIEKVDSDDQSVLLEGAVFEIYDVTGTRLLEVITTDEDGIARTSNKYKYGKYLIMEITPPEGYVLNAEYATGKVVVFDHDGIYALDEDDRKEDTSYTFTNTLGVWEFELQKVDQDNSSTYLAGAEFKFQEEINGDFVDVSPQPDQDVLTTNSEGKINLTLEHFEIGKNYRLVEITAPIGYIINEANPVSVDFTIDGDQTVLKTAMLTNEAVEDGSVRLTKVDDVDRTVLEGAVFDLEYNQGGTGNWINHTTNLTTDEDGVIAVDQLKGGQYRLVEQQAPSDYQLDDTPIYFTIEASNEAVDLEEIENSLINGAVELTKRGADNNLLAGVVFELQDDAGELLLSDLATDEDGKLLVEDLRPGWYQFKETATIAGYQLSEHIERFEITRSQQTVLTVDFLNELTPGTVRLTKLDEANALLADAEFSLFDSNDNVLQELLTTNEAGYFDLTLEPGFYKLIETKAPFGHDLDATAIEFEVIFNQDDQLEASLQLSKINQQSTSGVELIKKGERGDLLTGVTFKIEDEFGNTVVEDLETDEDGLIQFDGLKPGTYYFVETESIAGYDLLDGRFEFVIALGQEERTEIELENALTTGAVRLVKVGEEGEALENAIFNLVDEDGEEVVSGLETNDSGIIEVNDLKPGTYYFVETGAPFGHDLDPTPIEVTVTFDQQEIAEVTKTNERTTSGVELTKKGERGDLLTGVTFKIEDEFGNTVVEDLETDEDGLIQFDGLKPGTYYFVEMESIAGYDLLDGRFEFVIALGQEERTEIELENALTTGAVRLVKVGEEGEALENAIFNLVDEDGEEVVSGLETNDSGIIEVNDLKPGTYYFVETGAPFGHDLDPTPIEVTVVFDQQEIAEVAKTNERTTSGVELTKVDSETGERLVDATFELQTTEGEFISEHVTDEAGQIVVEGLKPGHYQFVETEAPFGYELDQRPILFAIDLGQITNTQISTDNQIVTGDFELTKLDFDNGHVLAGVEFELQAANGEFIEAGLTTDADGKLLLTGLRPGSYQLIETRALPGYQLLAGPIAFTIDRGQLAQKEIVITNMLTRGSVQLIKQNEAGNVLADAIFTLLDANGNELKAGLTTNEAGLIIVTDLRPGSYQFIETEAPEGYQLDNTPIDFEIEVGQVEILSINVTNEKIEVEPTGSTDIGESNSEREPKQQTDLPNTATQVYNVMTIGVSILLLGGILLTIRKKRKDF